MLIDLRRDALARAEKSWRSHKAPMAAYWKSVAVYAGHLARVLADSAGGVLTNGERGSHDHDDRSARSAIGTDSSHHGQQAADSRRLAGVQKVCGEHPGDGCVGAGAWPAAPGAGREDRSAGR